MRTLGVAAAAHARHGQCPGSHTTQAGQGCQVELIFPVVALLPERAQALTPPPRHGEMVIPQAGQGVRIRLSGRAGP